MIRRTIIGLGAVVCVALTSTPSEAAITWNLKPSGTGDWDWTFRGIYTTYEVGISESLQGILWSNNRTKAAPECIEISTGPGRHTANPDTRLWIQKSDGTLVSLNDDFGGTLQSKARLWLSFNGVNSGSFQYFTFVKPYSTSGSSDDFEVIYTRRDLTEAACTTSQTTIPWAKVVPLTNGACCTVTISPNAT